MAVSIPDEIAKNWADTKEAMSLIGVKTRKTLYELRDSKEIKHRLYLSRALWGRKSIAAFVGRFAADS